MNPLYKLSPNSILHVMERNYMSFKKLFKISIFPNLLDPILYLLAMGVGLASYVGDVNGISYFLFVTSGLIAATGMTASTAESTVNAFIQMRIEKTYYAITMTPVNLQDVIVGQALWSAVRSVIFGTMFLTVSAFFGAVHSWTFIFIPFVLFISGLVFGLMGLTFTLMAPSRDYLNYYNILIIKPLYMFSDTFFPVSNMPEIFQKIAWLSPLYHATNLCRGLLLGNYMYMTEHFLWLIGLLLILFYVPIFLVHKKLDY